MGDSTGRPGAPCGCAEFHSGRSVRGRALRQRPSRGSGSRGWSSTPPALQVSVGAATLDTRDLSAGDVSQAAFAVGGVIGRAGHGHWDLPRRPFRPSPRPRRRPRRHLRLRPLRRRRSSSTSSSPPILLGKVLGVRVTAGDITWHMVRCGQPVKSQNIRRTANAITTGTGDRRVGNSTLMAAVHPGRHRSAPRTAGLRFGGRRGDQDPIRCTLDALDRHSRQLREQLPNPLKIALTDVITKVPSLQSATRRARTITECGPDPLPVAGDGEPRDGQPDFRSEHASVEPRRGRATASGTLCVSQPAGGKKRPSQPTVALGTLWAADPAA